MYSNISITNLRSIKKLDLNDLKQINLFVGNNNCGKTTILESIFLLSGPTNPNLPNSINLLRGYNAIDDNYWKVIFNNLNTSDEINIKGDFMSPKEMRNLHLKALIEPIKINQADIKKIGDTNITEFINGIEMSLTLNTGGKVQQYNSKIYKDELEIKLDIAKNFKNTFNCTFLPSRFLLSDINKKLESIIRNKKEEKILKVLQKIDPNIQKIAFIGNQINFDIGLDNLVPIYILGDGIIKVLSIVITIAESPNGIVLIDEIENGLYTKSQNILWEAVFESSKEFNTQIFATTHSIECLRSVVDTHESLDIKDDVFKLFRIEKNNEEIKAIDYTIEILKESLNSGWEVR